MIILENLSKTFIKDGNRIEVLRNLNLEIKKGESLAVVGVSGAGKSTLIHILGTLDHPTSGTLAINGQNVFEWNDNCLLYTSDAADDLLSVDIGGRRIIKKKT